MTNVTHYCRLGCTTLALLALAACRTTQMPDFAHPGSAGQQRYNALQYDPYPLDDVAPAVAGTRPKEYDRPIPEVKRGQTYTPKRLTPQPIPMPSFSLPGAPAVVTPPAAPGATVSPLAPPANVPYQTLPPAMPPASTMVRPPY